MIFESTHLYHIYNQGNNRQLIFFSRENYLFFLEKIAKHILPYAEILAWCLMPNHFHLLVYIREMEDSGSATQSRAPTSTTILNATQSRAPTSTTILNANQSLTPTSVPTSCSDLSRNPTFLKPSPTFMDITNSTSNSLNKSIGILLASYTRAIHKQENITGSVFRSKTKAQCLTKAEHLTPAYFNSSFGTYLKISIPEKEYPKACFDYIHTNPQKAKLVKNAEDWEFSSYKDYCGLRNGKLINRERAIEFGLVKWECDSESRSH